MFIINKYTTVSPMGAEVCDQESLTEQGAEISVRDLMERFMRGLPLPDLGNRPDPEFDFEDEQHIDWNSEPDFTSEFGHDRNDLFNEVESRKHVLRGKLRQQQSKKEDVLPATSPEEPAEN